MEWTEKMTQRDKILWHLEHVGSLSRAEAMSEYGIVELPARIVELKKLGYGITSTREEHINKRGETIHYNRYRLEA